ncbi:MAG: hypothetical protein GY873_29175 [Bosea sp.]|uniref:RAMP superfamily CRISPR-associated protein n=1 Tax=Bosea sp. (in: a-proteobacteria) TaxID=1871050 RepID=UPI0023A4FF71|nr:hypothetical protein [Bosea sp. (in: a-proteobacteria)]MCP4738269.1 hypothetical protein [Bosea sp. (in: a-proteobacteria)]
MRERVVLELSLTIRSPFLFQGLDGALGIDAAALRDEQGRPVIPAEQVKGVLRAALDVLAKHAPDVATAAEIETLFGRESSSTDKGSGAGASDEPNRARIFFRDLVAEGLSAPSITTRVEIDDETGAAKTGALQMIELAAPFGAEVAFVGRMILQERDEAKARRVVHALGLAAELVPAIGALKSSGFGEVVARKISVVPDAPKTPASLAGPVERIDYRVSFDGPILVDARREAENLFVGSDIVPGAVFKGALATKLAVQGLNPETDPDWSAALSALHVSHAFPESEDGRATGLPIPFSALTWRVGQDWAVADALLAGGGVVSPEGEVAAHVLDWKGAAWDAFHRRTNWPVDFDPPSPLLRSHVKIERDSLVAADQQLFTTVAKSVWRRGEDRWLPRAWRLSVDFGKVPEAFRDRLRAAIEAGLEPIGKTQASATFEIAGTSVPVAAPIPGRPGLHAVTLATPALLLDPCSQVPVAEQYRAVIKQQTGGELLRFFALRNLAGGYVSMRRRPYGRTYYPFVLTKAGSVFLIEGADSARLQEIARFGFQPVALQGADTLDWRTCPYLPENGYGQAAFNLVDHAALGAELGHV